MASLRALLITAAAGLTLGAAAGGLTGLTPELTGTAACAHNDRNPHSCDPATASPSATPSPSPSASATPAPSASPTPAPTSGSSGSDAHGKAVSAAAHSCPHGKGGVHGKCVSAVAHQQPPGATSGGGDSADTGGD